MSNMSYCRFRNTLGDLRDCYEALDALLSCDTADGDLSLSEDELDAAKSLVKICARVILRVTEDAPGDDDGAESIGDFLDSLSESHGKNYRAMEKQLDQANKDAKEEQEREANGSDEDELDEALCMAINQFGTGEHPVANADTLPHFERAYKLQVVEAALASSEVPDFAKANLREVKDALLRSNA